MLRRALPDDADQLERLELELFPDNCFNARSLRKLVERGHSLAIDERGELVGYALCLADAYYTDLLRLGVVAGRRGCGLGSWMLRRVTSPTLLTVKRDNPAVQLYLRHVFSIVGVHSDSWVMVRTCGS
jgi:ribosomal protein S18 acetylase RimI-like enzyme